jgi:hypothetical protein
MMNPASPPRSRAPWSPRIGGFFAWLACPVALWLLGWFFLFGDLGKHMDDYHYGLAPDGSPPTEYTLPIPFVFRPVHRIVQPALQTILWNHDQVHHTLSALLMAANAGIVAWIVRRAGFSKHATLAGSVLYLMWPSMGELGFWSACVPTVLSIHFMLWALLAAQGLVLTDSPRRWWRVPVAALLTFASACSNEQAASYTGAVPLLLWATAARAGVGRRVWKDALIATGAMVLAGLTYVLLQRATMPERWPGAPDNYTALHLIPQRFLQNARRFAHFTILRNLAQPSLPVALQIIREHPLRAAALLAAVVGSAWLLRARAGTEAPEPCPGDRSKSDRLFFLTGIAVGACSILPILAVAVYDASFRMTHGYVLGIAMCVAVFVSRFEAMPLRPGTLRCLRQIGTTLLVTVGVAFSVVLIGLQGIYQERWRRDEHMGTQLAAAFPDLPPWCALLPMQNLDRTRLGDKYLDPFIRNALHAPWGSRGFARKHLKRMDVECRWRAMDGNRGYWDPTDQGVVVEPMLDTWYWPPGPPTAPDWRFPWSHVAAFIVDGDGKVTRVSEIHHFQGGAWHTYTLPLGKGGVPYVWK